jgi:epoxyqueuosine reductase
MGALERGLIDEARRLGFARCGIAAATPADGFDRLRAWLDRGFAGEMDYLGGDHTELRRDPRSIFPTVRSVIMVAMSYAPSNHENSDAKGFTGRIARYAQGADYHAVVRDRLKQLGRWLRDRRPGCWGRVAVDTAPLLERDFARRAGLGWFGKNTMLIDVRVGSWTVLGALLVDVELEPSEPFEASHCGTCTACLDACPTGAFEGPFILDARKCISYLTIELKSDVPEPMRPHLHDWVFGCDVCNTVCPWNRKAPPGEPALAARPELPRVDLIELLGMTKEAFRERFEGTALYPRPGRRVVLRNAALALGNVGDETALPALRKALQDEEDVVREAARWAIERIQQCNAHVEEGQ